MSITRAGYPDSESGVDIPIAKAEHSRPRLLLETIECKQGHGVIYGVHCMGLSSQEVSECHIPQQQGNVDPQAHGSANVR